MTKVSTPVFIYIKCTRILIFYSYSDNSYSQKNTLTKPILISISQDVSIISVTEITDEVNRCYQPTVDEKYEEDGE